MTNNNKSDDEKYCVYCGLVINRNLKICTDCGISQDIYIRNNSSSKSRMATLLMCVFFGWLGFHRYYVNKKLSGLIQIIAFILLILSVIGTFYLEEQQLDIELFLIASYVIMSILLIINIVLCIRSFIDLIMILSGEFKDNFDKKLINWTIKD